MPIFSESQQKVIDARDCTLLVSAAAGSGKTTVLVQRVIEKLLSGEHPQELTRLLVVTFTNAAASEMKERIGKRLSDVLMREENAGNQNLQRQALLLSSAPIMTIHSFCLSLLREFFYELSLDPSFRIADEAELTLMRADVMEELLEQKFLEKDPDFLALAESVGGKKEDALPKLVERLYKFSMSAPYPKTFLDRLEEELIKNSEEELYLQDTPCIRSLYEIVEQTLQDAAALSKKGIALCEKFGISYLEALENDLLQINNLLSQKNLVRLSEELSELTFSRLSNKKSKLPELSKEEYDNQKEVVKDIRDKVKSVLKSLKTDFFFAPEEEQAEDMRQMAGREKALISLCREFTKLYEKRKSEKGILDFDDLEHYAVKLLLTEENGTYFPTKTAKLLRSRYDEIMMDECQDSNQIQDLIMQSISSEDDGKENRFMVGDVKQSIYKFRMAMPELFIEKYNRYPETGAYRRMVLSTNYRSRDGVIRSVNDVFSVLMTKQFGGIEYDDRAKLYGSGRYTPDIPEHKTELLLTETDSEEETESEEPVEKTAAEAYTIGARIHQLIESGFQIFDHEETDENGTKKTVTRNVEYRDILVLLRSVSTTAAVFQEVFTELSLPALIDTQSGYFSSREVTVVLNALRIIDNPEQDIPLVAVLRSELVFLNEEELSQIRVFAVENEKANASFFEQVMYFLAEQEKEPSQDKAVQGAVQKLLLFRKGYQYLKSMVISRGVPELLLELYRISKYPELVSVSFEGERRAQNLMMLVEKAKLYEESSYSGIFDFIRYVERLIRYEQDSGEAKFSAGENAIRLMTIHKSKGLEAPVVIVAGLSRKFNFSDVNAEFVLHPKLGMGVLYRDLQKKVKAQTLFKQIIAKQLRYEMLSEEIRILYVAMTRAKEKLILSAAVKTRESYLKKVEAGSGTCCFSELLSSGNYLDFLRYSLPVCLSNDSIGIPLNPSSKTEETVHTKEEELKNRALRYEKLMEKSEEEPPMSDILAERKRRIEYRYPYPQRNGKRKVSVTELKRMSLALATEEEQEQEEQQQKPFEKILPEFLLEEKKKLSSTEKGTLVHRLMECFDFAKLYCSCEEVTAEIKRLINEGMVEASITSFLPAEKLLKFLQTPLAVRMREAAERGHLFREQPFVILLPYNEVYKEGEEEEQVMVQGIIDAFFEEEDGLVLLDYKTDFIMENAAEVLTKRYEKQLDYYRLALNRTRKKQVKECYLYSFSAGETIKL